MANSRQDGGYCLRERSDTEVRGSDKKSSPATGKKYSHLRQNGMMRQTLESRQHRGEDEAQLTTYVTS